MTIAPVFKETYEAYLCRIGEIDFAARQAVLGIEIEGALAVIPFFNKSYYVGAHGIVDDQGTRPHFSVCVALCKYLLMCPDEVARNRGLVTFKDFKDAAPLIQYFENTVQAEVARHFTGNPAALEKASLAMGGAPCTEDLAYQIKYRFQGLPRIPIYLLFNDAEEGFAAQCTMLFESTAEVYLDMETLAVLANTLSHQLKKRYSP